MAPPSTQQPPPGRLQGLSGASRGKPRFAPNVVGRRSKEEREKTAPAVKMEEKEPAPAKRQPQPPRRGRGGARNIGTRAEAAGPLAAPSLAPSGSRMPRRVNTAEGISDKERKLRQPKEENMDGRPRIKLENGGLQQEEEEELGSKVNIAEPEKAAEPFFPLRVPRDHVQLDESEIPVINMNSLYLFQIPELGLEAQTSQPVSNDNDDDDLKDTKFQDGRIGSLRKHASGRVTMKIGKGIFDVAPAAPSSSVEEVVLLKNGSQALRLGEIASKFVVVPEF